MEEKKEKKCKLKKKNRKKWQLLISQKQKMNELNWINNNIDLKKKYARIKEIFFNSTETIVF